MARLFLRYIYMHAAISRARFASWRMKNTADATIRLR